jgi:LPS sulfotransferase NodH
MTVELLDSVPGIDMTEEIFNPERVVGLGPKASQQRARRHLRRSLDALSAPVRGAKIVIGAGQERLTFPTLRELFDPLHVVIIYRGNLVEQFVSREEARLSNRWILRTGDERPEPSPVRIDVAEMRTFAANVRADYARVVAAAEQVASSCTVLRYEDLCSAPDAAIGQVISALGLPPVARVHTSTRKQGTAPLEERIANYEQIAAIADDPDLCLDLGETGD